MTTDHYIVFVGAGARLADELVKLEGRISKSRVIAPAVKKGKIGISDTAIKLATSELHKELSSSSSSSEVARLYLWMFQPNSAEQFFQVLEAFGHASWAEQVPRSYLHNVIGTRNYLENRTNEVRRLLHRVAQYTYAQRKTSPLSLPLRNFTSEITEELKRYWYNGLSEDQLVHRMRKMKNRYSQRKHSARHGYKDNKALIFKPAEDTELHGKSHPIGSMHRTFFCGRFRYGVSLFPGFHFDVTAENSPTIQCELSTPTGSRRSARDRMYVNIFPNDYILPEK